MLAALADSQLAAINLTARPSSATETTQLSVTSWEIENNIRNAHYPRSVFTCVLLEQGFRKREKPPPRENFSSVAWGIGTTGWQGHCWIIDLLAYVAEVVG